MEKKTNHQKFNRAMGYSSVASFKFAIGAFLLFMLTWAFGWLKVDKMEIDGKNIQNPNSFKNASTALADNSLTIWAFGTLILLILCAFGLVNNDNQDNKNQ